MSVATLPAFVDQVPDYDVRSGRMHIKMGGFELVMPVEVFEQGCHIGGAAVAKWRRKTFPRETGQQRACVN